MKKDKKALMLLEVSLPVKIAISTLIMVLLIAFVTIFQIPNPNMILIMGLVLSSTLYGFGGGIVAALLMMIYTLYFFSTDHSMIHFTTENLQKVGVSLIGVAADMFFICLLKSAEVRAFTEADNLSQLLSKENVRLEHLSFFDALTGIRNRMALREDYKLYQGHEVSLMMMDLNDFKIINDTRGHDEGDRILKETGELLARTFGEEHSYRYGGDEFLVIVPDITPAEFQKKLDLLMLSRPVIDGENRASFSLGHAHGPLHTPERLQDLIVQADERMYEVKREKKLLRNKNASQAVISHDAKGPTAYTLEEMRSFLRDMSKSYDLARVVDPLECRILTLKEDGTINMNESCYGIWNAGQKCLNCSSAAACRTGRHQEKAEHFKDDIYYVQSNPVTLKLPDGSSFEAVVELVKVDKDANKEKALGANHREAENIGNRAAHFMAHHDSLTNVLNADAFYELSREMIQNGPALPWMMITANIRSFHLVNALLGVLKGNEILIQTAAALHEISEEAGGLCGRLGGDQFALLLPRERYREEALLKASQALGESFNSGIYSFRIHFGIYEIDDPSLPISVMCGRANAAQRAIRENMSEHLAYFNKDIMDQILLEQKVIGGFEAALRDGQFVMYLQPLFMGDGEVIGAEALVRWQKPDGSLLMPGFFVETLERSGLIQKLDVFMWEAAVKQLSLWKGTKYEDLSISVNMSAKDFYSIDVYEVLTGLVDRYEVDSHKVRLEITETALMAEPEKSTQVVMRLRDRGFWIEIDDFGKGHSSLSLLKNIQADVLKIDMSLVQEVQEARNSRIILNSVISLADSLGMEVITEGVETGAQLEALKGMGCKLFQGFYFSRPLPVEEFEAGGWIRA